MERSHWTWRASADGKSVSMLAGTWGDDRVSPASCHRIIRSMRACSRGPISRIAGITMT